MITFLIILAVCILPGLPVAKAAYANAVRTHRLNPRSIQGRAPARPTVKLEEMLHQSGVNSKTGRRDASLTRCQILDNGIACSCSYRQDWLNLREQWRLYNEYKPVKADAPKPGHFIPVIPLWPLVLAVMYIKRGEIGIPDPAAVERMQAEIKQMETDLKELETKE